MTGTLSGNADVRVMATGTGAVTVALTAGSPISSGAVSIREGRCEVAGSELVTLGPLPGQAADRVPVSTLLGSGETRLLRLAASGTGRLALTIPAPGGTACAPLAKSLDVTPRVWFVPLPPPRGSDDYYAIAQPDAAWDVAAGRTQVYGFYGFDQPSMLESQLEGLGARNIAIALEREVLTPWGCGRGIEGFRVNAARLDLSDIRTVERLGYHVAFIALDEPLGGAVLNEDAPTACHWTVEQVAEEVATYVAAIHEEFPDIVIGDIEGWPSASAALIGEWLDAWRAAVGSDMPFLQLDVDWAPAGDDWPAKVQPIADDVHEHGGRFGIIYNGYGAPTDAEWIASAQAYALDYELAGFGPPDDVIFSSWNDKPDRLLPETGANSFTRLLADYARQRTAITTVVRPGPAGLDVRGRVETLGGESVPLAPVAIRAQSRTGGYWVVERNGTVPAGQHSALIGIRTNTEGAGPGPADVRIYEIGYSEGGEGTNRVSTPPFDAGSWGSEGDAVADRINSDRGPGSMLRIRATPEQWLALNSPAFPVTPGTPYRMWAVVGVPDGSLETTRVDLMFLGTSSEETSRVLLRLSAPHVPLGTTTPDASGAYAFSTDRLEPGRYLVTAEYAGDTTYWPALASAEITIP
jgi:hypothetical protein